MTVLEQLEEIRVQAEDNLDTAVDNLKRVHQEQIHTLKAIVGDLEDELLELRSPVEDVA